ncbi:hypothetical protein CDIF29684_03968 (plasmid) [Clostridioides difficile]|uniref:Uncharacterized protein n=2 Tax=Clostridioides difficile TaxID=1496 RepID=A0ACA7UPA1_CLODI|nr:hypothetical protein [Clostridioides difficile]AKP44801.1 hypothetical protein CDIF1296T_phi127 [Peptoclostridium phage phiCDIF1296T]EQF41325.1 hypothetical protein QG1_0243 [Clostridioides difficile CD166]EQL11131.1 hypothetical protein QE3_0255 [Clostridioides difficile CD88]CCL67192.1 hypothetical protein BN183_3940009 [Clostridioides difficile E7]MDI0305098.1 hypothetical protein [Clostridioides difficile]
MVIEMNYNYVTKIDLKYGNTQFGFEKYSDALDKYRELKEEFKYVPCIIKLHSYVAHQDLYVKEIKADGFEKKYLDIKNLIKLFKEHKQNISDELSLCDKKKEEVLHVIEEMNLDTASLSDKIDTIKELKNTLAKRRLVKYELNKYFAFCNTLYEIEEELKKYESKYKQKENQGKSRFKKNKK